MRALREATSHPAAPTESLPPRPVKADLAGKRHVSVRVIAARNLPSVAGRKPDAFIAVEAPPRPPPRAPALAAAVARAAAEGRAARRPARLQTTLSWSKSQRTPFSARRSPSR
jgi:hypothetical protein